ncbi:GAF and ANTAR domain-containing protein [Streptomyces niveus]|uniref:GAF and ANTAR domain-containing protein n=1 Tax=Streptomyces niveus TaxID=193462 RepID=UPI00365955D2
MDWERFGRQMASMARGLLAQDSVQGTLERITGSATELVEGCDAAGILVLHPKKVETLAPTHQLVVDCDKLLVRLGEGPCFDAAQGLRERRVFRIGDLSLAQTRWPAYAPRAHALGVGSLMGFLLFTEDDREELGALNLYSHTPGAFTEMSETAGVLLASHAAVALSAARTYAQMKHAVATRHVIGEAMGILMSGHHLTEEQAWDVLRRYSQKHNVKLREVASRVCEQGTLV